MRHSVPFPRSYHISQVRQKKRLLTLLAIIHIAVRLHGSISPITSDEEYWTDDSTEDSSSESDTDTEEAISKPQSTVVTMSNLQSTGEDSECEHQPASVTFYRICGDNIDKSVKHRYMRSDFQVSSSLHYFHSYATADRIDFSKL